MRDVLPVEVAVGFCVVFIAIFDVFLPVERVFFSSHILVNVF
jgi:hypothetical protein